MLVKFLTNLGSGDAARVGLNVVDCTCGAVTEVSKAEADYLINREFAEAQPEKEKQKAVPVETVQQAPTPKQKTSKEK